MTNQLDPNESPNTRAATQGLDDQQDRDGRGGSSRRPLRKILLGSLIVLLVGGILAGVLITREAEASSSAPAQTTQRLSTTPVTTGDLVATTNVKGTLSYSGDEPLMAGPAGVLTMLPSAGTVIPPGGELYRVNNSPVFLLRGDVPAWRSFEYGMSAGVDVRQLEENLEAFGLFHSQPDETFTWETAASVQAWQKVIGAEQTGRLDRSIMHFAPGEVRVSQLKAVRGADVAPGAELYRVTSTTKVVDLGLRLTDQQLAVVGARVMIALPDGSEASGVVAAVGPPTEQAESPSGATGASSTKDTTSTFVVPVSVTLDAPDATDRFPRASVTARFSTVLGKDVLTAPVEALVAIDADSFAVEVPPGTPGSAPTRIPVTLGAFSSGRVVVSGPGIEDGTAIVVPSS